MNIFEALNKSFHECKDDYGEGDIVEIRVCPCIQFPCGLRPDFLGCIEVIGIHENGSTCSAYIGQSEPTEWDTYNPTICYGHRTAKFVDFDYNFLAVIRDKKEPEHEEWHEFKDWYNGAKYGEQCIFRYEAFDNGKVVSDYITAVWNDCTCDYISEKITEYFDDYKITHWKPIINPKGVEK